MGGVLWVGDGALGWEKDSRGGGAPLSSRPSLSCLHHLLLALPRHLQLGLGRDWSLQPTPASLPRCLARAVHPGPRPDRGGGGGAVCTRVHTRACTLV